MLSVPARQPTPPHTPLPEDACDTHTHVFGPFERFPVRYPPDFPLPLAPLEAHQAMLATTGLQRSVIVQPAHYGFDHAALLDALARSPDARGIGLADGDVTDRQLDALAAAGVRGLRFTEFRNPDGSVRPGSVGVDQLRRLAPRLRERGWQAHVWAGAAALDALLPDLMRHGLPIVLDHMGMPDLAAGVGDPKFARLLDALRSGSLWVKLSLCRQAGAPDYDIVRPFHDALVEADPTRLLWGSDWPFIRLIDSPPDVGALLDRFAGWVADAELRRAILVDNPAHLFGFDRVQKGQ